MVFGARNPLGLKKGIDRNPDCDYHPSYRNPRYAVAGCRGPQLCEREWNEYPILILYGAGCQCPYSGDLSTMTNVIAAYSYLTQLLYETSQIYLKMICHIGPIQLKQLRSQTRTLAQPSKYHGIGTYPKGSRVPEIWGF